MTTAPPAAGSWEKDRSLPPTPCLRACACVWRATSEQWTECWQGCLLLSLRAPVLLFYFADRVWATGPWKLTTQQICGGQVDGGVFLTTCQQQPAWLGDDWPHETSWLSGDGCCRSVLPDSPELLYSGNNMVKFFVLCNQHNKCSIFLGFGITCSKGKCKD